MECTEPVTITGTCTAAFDTCTAIAALHAIRGRRILHVVASYDDASTTCSEIAAQIPDNLIRLRTIAAGQIRIETTTDGVVHIITARSEAGRRGFDADTLIIDTPLDELSLLSLIPSIQGSRHDDGPAWYQTAHTDGTR